jgi:hypothetical protein
MLSTEYKVNFSPIRGKKVFFSASMSSGRTIIVCSPHSKAHKGGQGWIDLTKIQIDLLGGYDRALIAFRLPKQQTYFLDFQQLRPLLTQKCTFVNDREGVHWKLYIWDEKIEVRRNDTQLRIEPNTFENIASCFI